MKNQKGVTLIALIITIIVMLILVVVTINIATTGGLIDKASEAKTNTQAATQNELNQMNTVANGIDAATGQGAHMKTIFDINKTYTELFLNPSPLKMSQLNLNSSIDFILPFNNFVMFAMPATLNGTWQATENTVSRYTEPENPSNGDLWCHYDIDDEKVFEYTNGNWIVRNDIIVDNYEPYASFTVGNFWFKPDGNNNEPNILYECSAVEDKIPETLLLGVDEIYTYIYIYTQGDTALVNQEYGLTTFEQGWNKIEGKLEDQTSESTINPINYSELPRLINCKYADDSEDVFAETKDYLGDYLSDTPWQ